MGIYCVEPVHLAELPKLERAATPKEQAQQNIFPYKCNNLFIIYFDIVLHNFPWLNSDLLCLLKNLESHKNLFHRQTVLSRNFQHWRHCC